MAPSVDGCQNYRPFLSISFFFHESLRFGAENKPPNPRNTSARTPHPRPHVPAPGNWAKMSFFLTFFSFSFTELFSSMRWTVDSLEWRSDRVSFSYFFFVGFSRCRRTNELAKVWPRKICFQKKKDNDIVDEERPRKTRRFWFGDPPKKTEKNPKKNQRALEQLTIWRC